MSSRLNRYLLAILSGVLFALAFPGVGAGWLSFVSILPLVLATVRSRGIGEAFLLGWTSQTVAWLIMVPWVIRVMSHYGGLPLPVGILIFVAMALYLGLWGGLFSLIVRKVAPDARFFTWLIVPAAWAALEFGRTYAMTGFPWNLLAASIVNYAPLVQIDRVVGPYAIGVLLVLPQTAIAWMLLARPTAVQRAVVGGGIAVLVFVWWATGLIAAELLPRSHPAALRRAALLQPNISQEMRWDTSNLMEIFGRMMAMSERAAASGAKVVIWPESTVPLAYDDTPFFREAIESFSAKTGADVILGSVATNPVTGKMWNAAFLVSGGKTIGHYDKIRLVPFGEYVPLRKALFFAHKLVHEVGDFEFGTKDTPLEGIFHYGPAICYEVVYPQITRTQVRNGADVLVTITNDAWYDGTSAPEQHLNQARLRAIEDDRWLLRAATTGISAVVDPAGRIIQQIPMGREGTIDARFEPRFSKTPYVRFGDWFAWLTVLATVWALVAPAVFARRAALTSVPAGAKQ